VSVTWGVVAPEQGLPQKWMLLPPCAIRMTTLWLRPNTAL
jgi:hypothetical protein